VPDDTIQYTLFESPVRAENVRRLYEAVDVVRGWYGKHALHLGGAHAIDVKGKGRRGEPTVRDRTTLFGETKRKHLGLPIIHIKI